MTSYKRNSSLWNCNTILVNFNTKEIRGDSIPDQSDRYHKIYHRALQRAQPGRDIAGSNKVFVYIGKAPSCVFNDWDPVMASRFRYDFRSRGSDMGGLTWDEQFSLVLFS